VAGALVGGSLWIGVRWFTWRPPALGWASRAVLPFYVLHHPVTVAVAAMVVQWPIGLWAKYAAIATLALIGTLALTELVMRTAVGRSLFGLGRPLAAPATDGMPRPAPLGEV
jgi:glucans biosynthesis protein C